MNYLREGRTGERIYHVSLDEMKAIKAEKKPYRTVAVYQDEQGRPCGYDVALMPDPAPLPRAG